MRENLRIGGILVHETLPTRIHAQKRLTGREKHRIVEIGPPFAIVADHGAVPHYRGHQTAVTRSRDHEIVVFFGIDIGNRIGNVAP